jgi:anaerobic magnesium-protoporphyrin IX monomethyl ester cyclase
VAKLIDKRNSVVDIAFIVLKSKTVSSFGIMYLSAVLKQAGHAVRLLQVENSADLIMQLASSGSPDILAFSATTGLHKCYLAMSRLAKQRFNVISVFGGSHATFFPEMIEQEGVDAVCIGEGERAFAELADKLQAGADITAIRNWWIKQDGYIHKNAVRPLERDLDQLPYPDWDLYYESNPALRHMTVRPILASRGCPHSCSYCFNKSLNEIYKGMGAPVRMRQPETVINEIREIRRRYKTTLVWFLDSNLGVNREWLEELLGRYKTEIALPFYCKVRPDFVSSDVARLLADAGCTGAGVGIECGNDYLRNKILHRNISREEIIAGCRRLKEQKIRIMSFNMIGLPGETVENVFETMRLNAECGADYAMTMIMQPYPRTDIADYAIKEEYFNGNFDELDYDYYSKSVLKFADEKERHTIENLQRLFAIGVEFPFTQFAIRWAAQLPKNTFYLALFKLWHHHCFNQRFYNSGWLA